MCTQKKGAHDCLLGQHIHGSHNVMMSGISLQVSALHPKRTMWTNVIDQHYTASLEEIKEVPNHASLFAWGHPNSGGHWRSSDDWKQLLIFKGVKLFLFLSLYHHSMGRCPTIAEPIIELLLSLVGAINLCDVSVNRWYGLMTIRGIRLLRLGCIIKTNMAIILCKLHPLLGPSANSDLANLETRKIIKKTILL